MNFEPVVKWSGSKRSQAEKIVSYFPKEISTYYEPFCGGCSVLRQLLETKEIHVKKYVCSDINSDLISLWGYIKEQPNFLKEEYRKMWLELNKDEDINRMKGYYNFIRNEFNESFNEVPHLFLFLNRTCYNGLIRYNQNGDFNSPFHLTRKGINPDRLDKIIDEWNHLLNENDVKFFNGSYNLWNVQDEDSFVYLDPPYANTNVIYYGTIDYEIFFNWLRRIKCPYALSFNGRTSDLKDNTFDLPKDLYDRHEYIKSGKSSFRRLKNSQKDVTVEESLYLKFKK